MSIKSFIAFTAGVVIGSVATWKYLDEKYKKLAQEEIDSVKEVFTKRSNRDTENTTMPTDKKQSMLDIDYADQLRKLSYINYSNSDKKEVENKTMSNCEPYVIPPEKFGNDDNYELISLTYYSDNILGDDSDDVIDDVDSVVGPDALTSFGKYEDDCVFVRNEQRMTEYEILLDSRTYFDATKRMPPEVE